MAFYLVCLFSYSLNYNPFLMKQSDIQEKQIIPTLSLSKDSLHSQSEIQTSYLVCQSLHDLSPAFLLKYNLRDFQDLAENQQPILPLIDQKTMKNYDISIFTIFGTRQHGTEFLRKGNVQAKHHHLTFYLQGLSESGG